MQETPSNNLHDQIRRTTTDLLEYCKHNNWAGYDPYDALNSRLFAVTPLRHSRLCRIVFTQVLKRLPINLRPLLLIDKEQNPKGIALFLMAFVKLAKLGLLDHNEPAKMAEKLIALRSPDTSYWCWGYSFPWQTRTVLVPRGAPNLVCTTFVANSLLDLYEFNADPRRLSMALSAAEYILNELYWEDGESAVGFSYPLPGLKSRTHNANFLGAALLCRVYKVSGENKFRDPALKAARYSASRQCEDGSWDYGEASTQRWIDNFHTGYNLCALRAIGRYGETDEFEPHLRRGFDFYRKHFFREDGAPRYFHDRTFPIDVHSVAQSIITLLEFKDLHPENVALAHSVFHWALNHMWNGSGWFYYQVLPHYKVRIPYMRWSQAWMVLALASLKFSEQ
ncbi:MAG: hypothetical protein AB9866_04515 [Syntrophobacteraceae bacterium]